LNFTAGGVADNHQGSVYDLFEQCLDAVRNNAKRIHRVANPGFFRGYVLVEQVAWYTLAQIRFRPAAVAVVARNGYQQYRYFLREVLPQACVIFRAEKELIPVRRTAVDDHHCRQPGVGGGRHQVKAADVPVEPIGVKADFMPAGAVAQCLGSHRFECTRVERAPGSRVGKLSHGLATVRKVPAQLSKQSFRDEMVGGIAGQQLNNLIFG
jgi:hypothetical protein